MMVSLNCQLDLEARWEGAPAHCGWHCSLAGILDYISGKGELSLRKHSSFLVAGCGCNMTVREHKTKILLV